MPTSPLAAAAGLALALAWLAPVPASAHLAELEAVLDTAQEVPAPVGTTTASGTGTFRLEEDGRIEATVAYQGLTGPPLAAHIHQGAAGVAGGVLVDFSAGLPGLGPSGTIAGVGDKALTAAQQQALFTGNTYFNIHTATNPAGEIRGQLRLRPGPCSCDVAAAPGAFKRCVAKALRGVDKEERREDAVKRLRRLVAKSGCGRTKAPRKKVACCLPFSPAQNIVTDRMCGAVGAAQCARLGGTSLGAGVGCAPNPCRIGSPSGAFLPPAR